MFLQVLKVPNSSFFLIIGEATPYLKRQGTLPFLIAVKAITLIMEEGILTSLHPQWVSCPFILEVPKEGLCNSILGHWIQRLCLWMNSLTQHAVKISQELKICLVSFLNYKIMISTDGKQACVT